MGRYKRFQTYRYTPACYYPYIPVQYREKVKAIGGPYVPFLNYTRELVGHWMRGDRCWICLCRNSILFKAQHSMYWGILWCESCFKEYTISKLFRVILPLLPSVYYCLQVAFVIYIKPILLKLVIVLSTANPTKRSPMFFPSCF